MVFVIETTSVSEQTYPAGAAVTFTFNEELVLMSGSKTITVYELAQSGLVVSELKKTRKPR